MYRNMIVIMVVAIAFLGISINAVAADSTQLNVKPVSPASKIKAPASIAVPSPAPAPVVEPIPTKSVPDVAPKPKPSLTTIPKPVKKLPAPKQISPTPAPSKAPAVSSLPKVKPTGPITSLPQGVQQNKLPAAKVPDNLGKSTRIPGSAGKDLSRNTNIGNKLPQGHTTPTSGFGSRSGAAGLTQGVGRRDSIGSVQDEFADQMGPVIRTGKGAQMQGQGEEETTDMYIIPGEVYKNVPESEAAVIAKKHESGEMTDDDVKLILDDFRDTSGGKNKDGKCITEDCKQATGNKNSERAVDEGPTDGTVDGNYVNRNRVKGIFGGVGGPEFAPGEEPTPGGTIDPELLQSIQSSKTQVNFVDGVDLNSNNFEDLSEQAQQAVKNKGQGNPVSN